MGLSGEAPPGHFGLRGLAERVAELGGECAIGNRDVGGARLCADIPLPAEVQA